MYCHFLCINILIMEEYYLSDSLYTIYSCCTFKQKQENDIQNDAYLTSI